MTRELAEALSELDDPESIEAILKSVEISTRDSPTHEEYPHNEPLSKLYQRYLRRQQNRSPATRAQYRRTIPVFLTFAETKGVTTSGGISAGLIDHYIEALQATYERDATIITYTKNLRGWLRWLSKRNLCEKSVFRLLDKTELGLSPQARDEALPEPIARSILDQLRRSRRGESIHALMEICWNCGPRIGGIHSLDVEDFDPKNNEIQFRHRPETGTRLKNGNQQDDTIGDGERNVTVRKSVVKTLNLYIGENRPEVTDEFGRQPLFATPHGRAARSTLRRWIYQATSCRWSPKNPDGSTCAGDCNSDTRICPNSYYPHAVRRGAIVNHLSSGLRPDIASERFDVSTKILRKHYDPRSKRRKKEDRADAVRETWSN